MHTKQTTIRSHAPSGSPMNDSRPHSPAGGTSAPSASEVSSRCGLAATSTHPLIALDLFCGCGGIAAGLRSAGFQVLAGVDVEPRYMATFERNFPEAMPMRIDLSSVTPKFLMEKIGVSPGELDLIAGGPPCQGFSKNVPRRHRFMDDPNNLLIRTYLDFCVALKPKMVLMENVAEMKNGFSSRFSEEVLARLEQAGYAVTHVTLNAAEFGIPQRRRRAFFLASSNGQAPRPPSPTHGRSVRQGDMFYRKPFVTVWNAIGDLPSLHHGDGEDPSSYACGPFCEYQRKIRADSSQVHNHVARHLAPTQYARLASLLPGQGNKDLPEGLKTKGGYSGAYGRLTKDMVAPTITRWVFHPGSGRWGHPVDIRTLTIREAARIQGFADSYEFVGSFVQQAGQLGNAVPPLLIEKVATAMRDQLVA